MVFDDIRNNGWIRLLKTEGTSVDLTLQVDKLFRVRLVTGWQTRTDTISLCGKWVKSLPISGHCVSL